MVGKFRNGPTIEVSVVRSPVAQPPTRHSCCGGGLLDSHPRFPPPFETFRTVVQRPCIRRTTTPLTIQSPAAQFGESRPRCTCTRQKRNSSRRESLKIETRFLFLAQIETLVSRDRQNRSLGRWPCAQLTIRCTSNKWDHNWAKNRVNRCGIVSFFIDMLQGGNYTRGSGRDRGIFRKCRKNPKVVSFVIYRMECLFRRQSNKGTRRGQSVAFSPPGRFLIKRSDSGVFFSLPTNGFEQSNYWPEIWRRDLLPLFSIPRRIQWRIVECNGRPVTLSRTRVSPSALVVRRYGSRRASRGGCDAGGRAARGRRTRPYSTNRRPYIPTNA